MKLHFFSGIFFFSIAVSSIQNIAHSKEISSEMKSLCAEADEDYTPPLTTILYPREAPLYLGIELGSDRDETVHLLAGRHPDKIAIHGNITPLMYSVTVGNWQASDALIKAGADVNKKDLETNTSILEWALLASKFSIACKLIENNARLPKTNYERNKLMGAALTMNQHDATKGAMFIDYLLSSGFSADETDSTLETPLMTAVSSHNIPVIKVLLKHDANLDVKRKNGRTVWTVAREKNNPQVLKLLKEAQKKATPENRPTAAATPATM